MLILGMIVFGMAIGWIAQLILGRSRLGQRNWGEALVAGLLGSFVGGLLVSLISGDGIVTQEFWAITGDAGRQGGWRGCQCVSPAWA